MSEELIKALYEIADHASARDTLDETLASIVKLATSLVNCDECCTYVRQGIELVPWVWKYVKHESMDRVGIPLNEGFAAALAGRRSPLAISDGPSNVCTFREFENWSTDPGETFVSVPFVSRSQLIGAMTLHHWHPHSYSRHEIKFLSTVGCLVGADLGIASLERENAEFMLELETRKLVERSKGILQRDFGMTEREAHLALQRQSQEKSRSMKEIANAIILSAELRQREVPTDGLSLSQGN